MTKKVLGFDISSSCIGFCLLLLDEEKKTIKLGKLDHFKPIKRGTVLERLQDTRDKMADVINQLQPDDIAIEDIITYMPKRSSANTIILLATFNRMMCLLSLDYLGKSPAMYDVMDIRRGIKEGESPPSKDEVPELIAKHLGISFPWIYGKKGGLLVENGDRADACAVALFHSCILAGLRPPPLPKKRKVKTKKQTKAHKKLSRPKKAKRKTKQ
jgi:Holliday junction resolvasome RuvABC endonuclease subunit